MSVLAKVMDRKRRIRTKTDRGRPRLVRARCASECVGRHSFPLHRGLWRGSRTTLRRRPVAGGTFISSTHLKSGANLWLSGLRDELAHLRSWLVRSVQSVLKEKREEEMKDLRSLSCGGRKRFVWLKIGGGVVLSAALPAAVTCVSHGYNCRPFCSLFLDRSSVR